mgnify:CR=1 FL=1
MVAMRNPCIWCCLVLLTLVVCDSCLHEERKHLMDICDAFLWPAGNPPDWSSRDCCRWERVTCSSITGRVTALDLDAAYPSWYGLLNCSMFLPFRELQNLSLGNAGIAGCMPGAGQQVFLPSPPSSCFTYRRRHLGTLILYIYQEKFYNP